MFPADPCGLLSGFKSIAMPQLWADSLLPVRGDEKQSTRKTRDLILQPAFLDAAEDR